MSTVKFKNGTTRKEGWKGQMTKYSAERLGANKKEVAGFFRVCGRWAVKMAAVQIGQCDGSSQVEVVSHSHPLSFLSQPDTCPSTSDLPQCFSSHHIGASCWDAQ